MIDFDWWEFHRVFWKNVSRDRICNSCEVLYIQRKGKDYATTITMWCTGGHKGRRQTNWLLFKTLPSLLLGIKPGKSKQLEERKWQVALVKLDPWCELIGRKVEKRSASWYSFKYQLVFGGPESVEGSTCWYLEEPGSVLGSTDWYLIVLGR